MSYLLSCCEYTLGIFRYLFSIYFCVFYRFAAALIEQKLDCWVMNVVPVSGSNTLPVIYDRGLIGVMHDWYTTNCIQDI
jgi:hypothetical protein